MPEKSSVCKVCSGNCRNQQEGGKKRRKKEKPESMQQKWKTDKGPSQRQNWAHQSEQSEHQAGSRAKETAGNKASGKEFQKNFEIKIKLNERRDPDSFLLPSSIYLFFIPPSYSSHPPPTRTHLSLCLCLSLPLRTWPPDPPCPAEVASQGACLTLMDKARKHWSWEHSKGQQW